MNTNEEKSQEYKLEPGSELMFQINLKTKKVYLTLKTGSAEILGADLVIGHRYELEHSITITVFTSKGCTLELQGKPDGPLIKKKSPLEDYTIFRNKLERLRQNAEKENKKGPVCMIVGPSNVGKSTICRTLLNYSVKDGRTPVYVDTDMGQGHISIPGTIGTMLIEKPVSVEGGFEQEDLVLYHYGHTSSEKNPSLYKKLLQKLAESVKEKLEVNEKTKVSGAFINTCGWVKQDGYKQLLHIATAFEVNIIIVIGDEKLYDQIITDMPVHVRSILLPKYSTVHQKTKEQRIISRNVRIQKYFYGTPKNPLCPNTFEVTWSEVKFYEIAVPFGHNIKKQTTKLIKITPSVGLLNRLFAISQAVKENDDIIDSSVAGFVCVTNIDVDRRTVTFLSLLPKPLPSPILVLSSLAFTDEQKLMQEMNKLNI